MPLQTLADLGRSKTELVAENALLRKPLIILKRHVKRPALTRPARILLVLLADVVRTWQRDLVIVLYRWWVCAMALKIVGATWDICWHFRWLRDDFAPPHLINSVGLPVEGFRVGRVDLLSDLVQGRSPWTRVRRRRWRPGHRAT